MRTCKFAPHALRLGDPDGAAKQFFPYATFLKIVSHQDGNFSFVGTVQAVDPAHADYFRFRRAFDLRHQRQFAVVVPEADSNQALMRDSSFQTQ